MSTLKIERLQEKEICVVCLNGQFDAVAAPESERALLAMAAALETPVVVDLSRVEYIGSLGLQAMLRFGNALREKQLPLRLCGLSPFVKQVFEISQFSRLFDIRPTRDDAVGGLSAEPTAPQTS
ncbi:MAG: STAS domain-containing protein [FCB group bacterium]|nr:STAS domain-containing protein [FCB group bacterium]